MIVLTWGDEATPLLSEEQIYDAIHFALASRFRLLRESRARKAQLGYHGTGGVGGDEFLKRRNSSERIQSGKIRFVFFVETSRGEGTEFIDFSDCYHSVVTLFRCSLFLELLLVVTSL